MNRRGPSPKLFFKLRMVSLKVFWGKYFSFISPEKCQQLSIQQKLTTKDVLKLLLGSPINFKITVF